VALTLFCGTRDNRVPKSRLAPGGIRRVGWNPAQPQLLSDRRFTDSRTIREVRPEDVLRLADGVCLPTLDRRIEAV
jgi:hypothetical protein